MRAARRGRGPRGIADGETRLDQPADELGVGIGCTHPRQHVGIEADLSAPHRGRANPLRRDLVEGLRYIAARPYFRTMVTAHGVERQRSRFHHGLQIAFLMLMPPRSARTRTAPTPLATAKHSAENSPSTCADNR